MQQLRVMKLTSDRAKIEPADQTEMEDVRYFNIQK